jgi:hypothetical protein
MDCDEGAVHPDLLRGLVGVSFPAPANSQNDV